jgi:single-strand DNA-binding protein
MNKCTLIGRLGKDPELSYTTAGVAMVKFSVATSERYTDKDGNKQETTEWHNIVAFRRAAEVLGEYLRKGHRVSIIGKLKTRSWDGDDGKKRYMTEVLVDEFEFLENKGTVYQPEANEDPAHPTSKPKPVETPQGGEQDPLPF